jgi:hypothetical protein
MPDTREPANPRLIDSRGGDYHPGDRDPIDVNLHSDVTLRDLFAGMVAGGLIPRGAFSSEFQAVAEQAYRMADALLAVREGRG